MQTVTKKSSIGVFKDANAAKAACSAWNNEHEREAYFEAGFELALEPTDSIQVDEYTWKDKDGVVHPYLGVVILDKDNNPKANGKVIALTTIKSKRGRWSNVKTGHAPVAAGVVPVDSNNDTALEGLFAAIGRGATLVPHRYEYTTLDGTNRSITTLVVKGEVVTDIP
jgi:hypothetical protein